MEEEGRERERDKKWRDKRCSLSLFSSSFLFFSHGGFFSLYLFFLSLFSLSLFFSLPVERERERETDLERKEERKKIKMEGRREKGDKYEE